MMLISFLLFHVHYCFIDCMLAACHFWDYTLIIVYGVVYKYWCVGLWAI